MILCADMAEDGAALELRCRACNRVLIWPGRFLVQRFGGEASVAALAARLRCTRDGMVPDACIVLPVEAASREALRRGLPVHATRRP